MSWVFRRGRGYFRGAFTRRESRRLNPPPGRRRGVPRRLSPGCGVPAPSPWRRGWSRMWRTLVSTIVLAGFTSHGGRNGKFKLAWFSTASAPAFAGREPERREGSHEGLHNIYLSLNSLPKWRLPVAARPPGMCRLRYGLRPTHPSFHPPASRRSRRALYPSPLGDPAFAGARRADFTPARPS